MVGERVVVCDNNIFNGCEGIVTAEYGWGKVDVGVVGDREITINCNKEDVMVKERVIV